MYPPSARKTPPPTAGSNIARKGNITYCNNNFPQQGNTFAVSNSSSKGTPARFVPPLLAKTPRAEQKGGELAGRGASGGYLGGVLRRRGS